MVTDSKKSTNGIDLDKMLADSDDLLDKFPYAVATPGDDTPDDVNTEDVGVEIAMYLGWAIDVKLVSEKLEVDCKSLLEKFRKREIYSRTILRECCLDKLEIVHLNEKGNAFTACYYRPGWSHFYLEDLGNLFPDLIDFCYLKDDWQNYQAVCEMINSRFEEWTRTQGINA